jgi:hypothetical protein
MTKLITWLMFIRLPGPPVARSFYAVLKERVGRRKNALGDSV